MIILRPVWRGIQFIVQFIGLYIVYLLSLILAGAVASPIGTIIVFTVTLSPYDFGTASFFNAVSVSMFLAMWAIFFGPYMAMSYFLIFAAPFLCFMSIFKVTSHSAKVCGLTVLAYLFSHDYKLFTGFQSSKPSLRDADSGLTEIFTVTAFIMAIIMALVSYWRPVRNIDEERELGV